MKKKPELLKATGKSSLTIRNFLNNLKENDLHFENKQITQCVFLGVLRLKPVPSIFSNNTVPSASAPVNDNSNNTSKIDVKASSNKKGNKNATKKTNIKVSGKVTKKNTQAIKAAVRKLPVKKSDIIKIKLNTNKKVIKDKDPLSSPKSALAVPTHSSATSPPRTFLSSPTLSLTPVVSPTNFNPVQNLFDKLKQKIDEQNSEPGSSKIRKQVHKAKKIPESNVTSKVCKINANRSDKVVSGKNPNEILCKKPGIHDGHHLMAVKTSSPITISDTESISKKDEDDVTLITDDSNSSSSLNQDVVEHTGTTEDIIFVPHESTQKNKTKTSPRNKVVNETEVVGKPHIATTNQAQTSTKTDNNLSPSSIQASSQVFQKFTESKPKETNQTNEIIIISDEIAIKEAPISNKNTKGDIRNPDDVENDSRNDIIVIDEIREIRVSPRLKKADEPKQKEVPAVINNTFGTNKEVTTPKATNNASLTDRSRNTSGMASSSKSKTQELSITVDDDDTTKNNSKTSPKLLKIVDKNNKITLTIKNNFRESTSNEQDVIIINDKPKQRKNKPLLPPVLLTPMLLRSELAQKKSNSTPTEEKSRASTSRQKSHSRLLRSNIEPTTNIENQVKKNTKSRNKSSTRLLRSELSPNNTQTFSSSTALSSSGNELAFTVETVENTKSGPSGIVNENKTKDFHSAELDSSNKSLVEENLLSVSNDEKIDLTNEVIIVSDEQTYKNPSIILSTDISLQMSKLEISLPNEKNDKLENKEVFVKRESKLKETISPRLLRSDIAKQRSVENSPSGKKEDLIVSVKNENENSSVAKQASDISGPKISDVNLIQNEGEGTESSKSSNKHYSRKSARQADEDIIFIKEESILKEYTSPRSLRSDINEQKKRNSSPKKNNINIEDTIVINENSTPGRKDKTSPKLRSEVNQQNKQKSSQNIDTIYSDKIVVGNEQIVRKPRDRSNGRLLRSELALQKSKQKSPPQPELEKVVVLIHDEPKSKERDLTSLEVEEVQESFSIVQEQTQAKTKRSDKSPVSSKLGKTQKQNSEYLPDEVRGIIDDFSREETIVVKHTTCSRLLRSEIISHSLQSVPKAAIPESSTPFRFSRCDITSDEVQQNDLSTVTEEKTVENQELPRVLRSENVSAQKTPKSQDQFETSEKQVSSPRSHTAEITSPRRSKDLSKDVCVSIEIIEDDDIEQVTSFQMPRSEFIQQNKKQSPKKKSNISAVLNIASEEKRTARLLRSEVLPQNTPKSLEANEVVDSKTKEVSPYRRRRSLLMDLKLKQKTPMLLRSELAQLKTVNSSVGEGAQKNSQDKTEKDVSFMKVVEVPSANLVPNALGHIDVNTNDMGAPKRKSLFDDLKRKKAAKEKGSLLPTSESDKIIIADPTPAATNIPDQSNNIQYTCETTDLNKLDDSVKQKRSPRGIKLSRIGNQKNVTLPEEIKIVPNDTIVPKHNVSPTRKSMESKDDEGNSDKANNKDKSVSPTENACLDKNIRNKQLSAIKKKSKQIIGDLTSEGLSENNDMSSPQQNKILDSQKLSPKEKSLSPKEESLPQKEKSLSPRGKTKEMKEDSSKTPVSLPDHSETSSPKECKISTDKKLAFKDKRLSPKRRVKEVTPAQEDKVDEIPAENNESEKNIPEVIKKVLRKQNRALSRNTLKEGKNNEASNFLEKLSQDNSPPGETAPKQNSSPLQKRISMDVLENPEVKLEESNTDETPVDKIMPNCSSPKQRSLLKQNKVKTVTTEGSCEAQTTYSHPSDVLISEINENHSSKRGKKLKKPTLKIIKVKAKTGVKKLAKGTPKASTSEMKSAENVKIPPKQKKKTKKELKESKSIEENKLSKETIINPVLLSPEVVEPKPNKKKRNPSPLKGKKRSPKGEEAILIAENLSQDNVVEANKSKENSNGKVAGSLFLKRKKRSPKGEKAILIAENLPRDNVVEANKSKNSNGKVAAGRISQKDNAEKLTDSTEVNKSKANAKKRAASPSKRNVKRPNSGEKLNTENQIENNMDFNIPEVKLETNDILHQKPKQKRKTLSAKKKSRSPKNDKRNPIGTEPNEPETMPENIVTDNSAKKLDTTVFDFDESEPEVVPLRLSNTPKKAKVTKPTVVKSEDVSSGATPATKKQRPNKTNKSITKAQAKTKLLAMFNDKSPGGKEENSVRNKTDSSHDVTDKSNGGTNIVSDKALSATKTSPLKQTTITDMFSRVMIKKEKSATNIFGTTGNDTAKEATPEKSTAGNGITDMPPPKFEEKPLPSRDGEENVYYDEDDSDCESRMEWIPEEYAEYKFKYSAKKMMNYRPIHKCKICLLILPSYYKLCKHRLVHAKKENPYSCTQCEQIFSSVDDLRAHLRLHRGKHPYTCKKCDIGFWSKAALDGHTPIHVLRKVKQPNKRFRCDVCAKEFSKLCDMERHTRVHTGEKPCVCNICNKRFQQSHNLSKHLLTHLHVKPYHCEICNKKFGRNDVLDRHLLTHSLEKPLKCDYCNKGFIRQSQLNNHMKKNHVDALKVEAEGESIGMEAIN